MNTSLRNRSPGSTRRHALAFTLLELLVVISIIAILAGILLPVTGSVMESARKTSAKNTVTQIVAAIKAYQTDYGVYPVIPGAAAPNPPVDTTFDGTNNQDLFNILRADGIGSDVVASSPNTRRIVYFEGRDVKNAAAPRDGFLPTNAAGVTQASGTGSLSAGALVDPWGNGYYVRYDSGYDDQVMLPEVDGGTAGTDSAGQTGTSVLRFGVIAWSFGKDGMKGAKGVFNAASPAYGDDVVSWQ